MISFSEKNHTLFRTFDSVKLKRNTQSTNVSNLIVFKFARELVFGSGDVLEKIITKRTPFKFIWPKLRRNGYEQITQTDNILHSVIPSLAGRRWDD